MLIKENNHINNLKFNLTISEIINIEILKQIDIYLLEDKLKNYNWLITNENLKIKNYKIKGIINATRS